MLWVGEVGPLVLALFIIQDNEPSSVVPTNSAIPSQSHEGDVIRVVLFTQLGYTVQWSKPDGHGPSGVHVKCGKAG